MEQLIHFLADYCKWCEAQGDPEHLQHMLSLLHFIQEHKPEVMSFVNDYYENHGEEREKDYPI